MSKLYAKITNEAGKTAGKSGEEYLEIDIMIGNQRLMRHLQSHERCKTPRKRKKTGNWSNFDETITLREALIEERQAKRKRKHYVHIADKRIKKLTVMAV